MVVTNLMEVTNQGVKNQIDLVQEALGVLVDNINGNVQTDIDQLNNQISVLQVEFPLKRSLLELNKHKRELYNNYKNIKKNTEDINKDLKTLMMYNSLINQPIRTQRRTTFSRGSPLGISIGGYNKTKKNKR